MKDKWNYIWLLVAVNVVLSFMIITVNLLDIFCP